MFTGCYERRIDHRGYVTLPAGFRAALFHGEDKSPVVLSHFLIRRQLCLDVNPVARWQDIASRYASAPLRDKNMVAFRTYVLSGAIERAVNRRGQILIPRPLREDAGLRGELVISGGVSLFRIFSREAWDKLRTTAKHGLIGHAELQAQMENGAVLLSTKHWRAPSMHYSGV